MWNSKDRVWRNGKGIGKVVQNEFLLRRNPNTLRKRIVIFFSSPSASSSSEERDDRRFDGKSWPSSSYMRWVSRGDWLGMKRLNGLAEDVPDVDVVANDEKEL
ncbi:hypothetical protein BDZ89DRAFT_1056057 [Hymenopellis radicata]|nr:hypothetical protein BDZ89DRAFT_1056057 [Hymenopellis radicata]